ncbi:unnamed protein product, partial [Prorocentrum cordatum]
ANGKLVNISMGQGQEKVAIASLHQVSREGGWVMLQNVHLMQAWLRTLERNLELLEEFSHPDFRCILTSEPPSALQGCAPRGRGGPFTRSFSFAMGSDDLWERMAALPVAQAAFGEAAGALRGHSGTKALSVAAAAAVRGAAPGAAAGAAGAGAAASACGGGPKSEIALLAEVLDAVGEASDLEWPVSVQDAKGLLQDSGAVAGFPPWEATDSVQEQVKDGFSIGAGSAAAVEQLGIGSGTESAGSLSVEMGTQTEELEVNAGEFVEMGFALDPQPTTSRSPWPTAPVPPAPQLEDGASLKRSAVGSDVGPHGADDVGSLNVEFVRSAGDAAAVVEEPGDAPPVEVRSGAATLAKGDKVVGIVVSANVPRQSWPCLAKAEGAEAAPSAPSRRPRRKMAPD